VPACSIRERSDAAPIYCAQSGVLRCHLCLPMLLATVIIRPRRYALSRTELVEFRMTVDAAVWVRNANLSAPIPLSSTAFLMAAAAESLLRDNAPAESVPVMM
jgi:hypothetical protein